MTAPAAPPLLRLLAPSGSSPLRAALHAHGGLQTLASGELTLNLFAASALEAGPANLWLRWHQDDGAVSLTPLLGPAAPGRQQQAGWPGPGRVWHQGLWRGVAYRVALVLAADAAVWFWHVELHNLGALTLRLDLVYLQDVALAPWAAIRLNEAYISQYLDHQPLHHAQHGCVLATRQNAPVRGQVPWLLSGSLGQAVGFATDALQVLGLARRAGHNAGLLHQPLASQRLQHEHALVGLQEAAFTLAPGAAVQRGFYGAFEADHPAPSGAADLATVARVLALPEATPPAWPASSAAPVAPAVPAGPAGPGLPVAPNPFAADPRSLFACAPRWPSDAPDAGQLQAWFGGGWRHVERDSQGQVLSFFNGDEHHVVTRDQEFRVLRPHGHLLRSGGHWTPDEQAVASTVWMAGVFHSSLTQGHASANRCLSTQRGYLGLFQGLGLRVFVDAGSGWQLLDVPSALRMAPQQVVWVYQAGTRCIEVVADVVADVGVDVVADAAQASPSVGLHLRVLAGAPVAVLLSHHVTLNSPQDSDDGLSEGPVHWRWLAADALHLQPAPGSALAGRFGTGGLRLQWRSDGQALQVLGDEALFLDGLSRRLPYLCLRVHAVQRLALTLTCTLVPRAGLSAPGLAGTGTARPLGGGPQPAALHWQPPASAASPTDASTALRQLADWLPWLAHNALVHYLTPRGLEQFSGGGWGTRDVCQGPTELLLALGRFDALRDLLCRVFAAQNADGDWPQWFMFYPRDAHIRADDSHGDIVFWPLVALADYLLASGDATLLDELLPYHPGDGGPSSPTPLAEHVARALAVIRARTIAGTHLAAYGHGDWNDALQPANPAMREHLCSAWTVTLHHRMLRGLAAALRHLNRPARPGALSNRSPADITQADITQADMTRADMPQAAALDAWADMVQADFQRLLVVDGVVAGYATFEAPGEVGYLLHPRDARTSIHYSALPMVHAVLDGLFSPTQAAAHADLITRHLQGPDGLRLFDRPLRYSGGAMRLFQRGESASYFGREVGLMYMHAHLRWAEALAQLGRADAFLHALRLANPIGLDALLPQAAPRQRNCYYSSSDAAFADRDQAGLHYGRIARGEVALEGGWRIYSSGAGIAYRLVLQRLLGLTQQQHRLGLDPVLPTALDGLLVRLPLYGHPVRVRYRVGPRGHGPLSATLDGQPLACTPGHNPYRAPGVWLDAQALRAGLAGGAAELLITLG